MRHALSIDLYYLSISIETKYFDYEASSKLIMFIMLKHLTVIALLATVLEARSMQTAPGKVQAISTCIPIIYFFFLFLF